MCSSDLIGVDIFTFTDFTRDFIVRDVYLFDFSLLKVLNHGRIFDLLVARAHAVLIYHSSNEHKSKQHYVNGDIFCKPFQLSTFRHDLNDIVATGTLDLLVDIAIDSGIDADGQHDS